MIFLDWRSRASRRSGVFVSALLTALMLVAASTTLAAPKDDLAMTFSSERVVGGPGNIIGAVTNRSNLRYPCVDAVFSLSTHFEDRQKGLPVVSYGNQSIRIRDIAPGATNRFSAPLRRKAGFGFLRFETCAEPAAEPPLPQTAARPEIKSFRANRQFAQKDKPVKLFWTTRNASAVSLFANGIEIETRRDLATVESAGFPVSPDEATTYLLIAENRDGRKASQEVRVGVVTVTHTRFCKIAGRVTGGWRLDIADRPGGPTSEWIVDMLLFKRGENMPKAEAKVTRDGRYVFARVPVEGSYFVRPSWKGQPNQVDVRNCQAGKTLQIRDIRITGRPLID